MRKGFASLAIVGVAACVAMYAITQTPHSEDLHTEITGVDLEFIKYVTKFGKSYGTKEEFAFRAGIFKKNFDRILEENNIKDNTFTVGLNHFADWTPAEYKRILSFKPRVKNTTNIAPIHSNVSIPSSIDWRETGAVNAVKDQG
jgi:C1A family cysteine protease